MVSAWEPQGRRLLTLSTLYFLIFGCNTKKCSVGSQHASFSDFPVLPVVRTKAAETLIDLTAKLSLAYLDDTLDTALERVPTRKMEEKVIGKRKDGRPKRTLIGEVGEIVVH